MNTNSHKGFTLVEILVVIAVIGILVSIVYANFSAARVNAKNKALRTTLSEVQLALEVYKAQHRQYPSSLSALVPEFLPAPPVAGNFHTSCNFSYSSPDQTYYKLTALNCYSGATTAATGVQRTDEFARCASTCPSTGVCVQTAPAFYNSMAIYSSGAECL